MIIFLLFVFYWLGVSFRYAYIPLAITGIILLLIVFFKYKNKFPILLLGIFAIGVGVSYIKFDYNTTSFSGFVIESHENYFLLNHKGENLYAYQKEHSYEIGDYLEVVGQKEKLDFVTLESQFDFQDYLEKKGVNYSIAIEKITVLFSNPIRIKKMREKFLSHFSDDQQSLINALLFSDRDDSEDLINMKKLHIMRLASASGIFIYAYLSFLHFFISLFQKKKKKTIFPLLMLIPYLVITFPRFTVVRVFFLELLRWINRKLLKNRLSSLTLTGIGGMSFLLVDYHLGYQVSFVMGFVIPIFASFINDATFRYKKHKKRIIQGLLLYIAIIPFELKFYNGINPLSLIIITILSPIFIITAGSSLLALYGLPIYKFVEWLVKVIGNILSFLSPFAFQINGPPMNGVLIVLFAFIILFFLYHKSIEFKPFMTLGVIGLTTFLSIYCLPLGNLITTEVCFINVGQGDSCLVRKGTTAVLIDTGGLRYTDIATETLIPFFQKKRIYDIDLVITTHDDYDHCGAYDSLKENFYVKQLVNDHTMFPLTVGGITFNNYNNHITEMSEDNDQSLVVGFTLSKVSYLVTGDAPIKVEKYIIDEFDSVPCDILKVGHHGSATSTCDEFIKFLHPKEAVISCGKNNRYGHPKQSVLDALVNNNVTIRRTDIEGTITYKG